MKLSRGFTLIEIIITIVIMAVAAALFVAYMGTSVTQSPASAVLVSDQYKLIQKMEELTGKYRQALASGGGTVADLCTTFKENNVDTLVIDGVNIADAANTYCTSFTDTTNAYTTTTGNALLVTLSYKGQKLQTVFTK